MLYYDQTLHIIKLSDALTDRPLYKIDRGLMNDFDIRLDSCKVSFSAVRFPFLKIFHSLSGAEFGLMSENMLYYSFYLDLNCQMTRLSVHQVYL